MTKFVLVMIAFLGAFSCSLNAQILNGSFEQDPNNPEGPAFWESVGVPPKIVTRYAAGTNNYDLETGQQIYVIVEPNDGNDFVVLESNAYHGEDKADITQLTQIIDVNAGDCISGVYFFDANDYLPYDDTAYVLLQPLPNDPNSGPAGILLAMKRISDANIGNYGCMLGWEMFSHTFNNKEAGRYILTLGIDNGLDTRLPSYLLVDNLKITPGPPPPVCDYILAGDVNGDCKVDLSDFAIMTANWMIDCNADPNNPACVPK